MEDFIYEVVIPTSKKHVINKKNTVDIKEERLYPGYVLVRLEMTNDS